MLHTLVEIQSEFIRGGAARPLLDRFLLLLLEYTGSTEGFLGQVSRSPETGPRFQVLSWHPASGLEALTGLSLSDDARREEPGSLRSLLSSALAARHPVSAGALSLEGRAPDAPPLRSLQILPLLDEEGVVGLVGLANPRADQPWEQDPELQAALLAGASLLRGWRGEEQRRAREEEHRLQRAHLEQMKQALASVEDGLWDWHLPTRGLRVSRRWLEVLGYAKDELEPTIAMWRGLCHPEDLPEVDRLIRAHLEGDAPFFEFTYRARKKNGDWAWILARAQVVVRDEQGLPVRVMGTDVDITARKDSEARLSALIRAIPDLLFRMRVDGTFIDWNDGAPEPTALPPETFLGKKVQELPLPKSFAEETLRQVQHVIREGGMSIYEYELEARGKGMQRYEARVVRSGPDEAVCIVRNITERTLVEERQTQLIRAEKMASLGQLAAGIAHEINNPVGYVTSNLRTLGRYVLELHPLLKLLRTVLSPEASAEQGPPSEQLQLQRLRELWEQTHADELLADVPELIQESLTGGQRIKDIAQSLRSFAREDGSQPQVVDLNAELESTLRMVWSELKYKCEVRREFGALPLVSCYPTQIAQVFTNLLVNAAQAIEGQGEICIRTSQQGPEVVVEISDTGKGMTQETLERLFTPFFTTKPRGQGTGLGLSISRDIIARHGGRIEARSQLGQGSTFTVSLPLHSHMAEG